MRFRQSGHGRRQITPQDALSAPVTASGPDDGSTPAVEVPAAEESLTERWDRLASEAEADLAGTTGTTGPTGPKAPYDPEVTPGVSASAVLPIPATRSRRRSRDALVASALDMMKAALMDDDDDEPVAQTIEIHNHLPSHNLTVDVQPAQITPEFRVESPTITPTFQIQAAQAPDVHVNVEPPAITVEPAAITVEQPAITVHPAAVTVEQPAAPEIHVAAPDVHVTVEPPQPRQIRVQTDPVTGERIFIPDGE